MNEGLSLFGDKVASMILNAQKVASELDFTRKVEDTIEDLLKVVTIAVDAVEKSTADQEDIDLEQPEWNPNQDSMSDISIDDLIAETYVHGKDDAEIEGEFKAELQDTIKNFGWLLVAIGIALDAEHKKDLIKLLVNRSASKKIN